MKKPHPLFMFYFFILLLTCSSFAPLRWFWMYFLLIGAGMMIFRIHPKRLWRKTFIYLLAGGLTIFVYFYLDAWLFGKEVGVEEQGWTVLNLYLRMASALAATLWYRESATDRDFLFVLVLHRLPARLILLVMIILRMIRLMIQEFILFSQHFLLRFYRGRKLPHLIPWTKTLFAHFYRQAEVYAHYLCLNNLHHQSDKIRSVFHDSF